VRRYDELAYAAGTWPINRRVIARVEITAHRLQPIFRRDVREADRGTDRRFAVTDLRGAPGWLCEEFYRARGQAQNLIRAHKLHLASDRTSRSKATANQFRLLVHTAAYIGSCTPCAAWRPRPRSGATPSSTPSAWRCSRSPAA
jgi:hypothetical protein